MCSVIMLRKTARCWFLWVSQCALWPLYPFRVTDTKIFPGFMQRYNLKYLTLKIDKIIKSR